MTALWNSFKIAFSMYSKIPMAESDWTKENMRYVMCFFPLVGAVIGAIMCLWRYLGNEIGLMGDGYNFYVAVLMLIPPAVSGGIHLDGFLDTSDALSSWQPQEKRLEILKDSRAGAFAVIMGCSYFILSFGAYSLLRDWQAFQIVCLTFLMSRAFSSLAIVKFKMAKNTGLAATFSDGAQKKTVGVTMVGYIAVVGVIMVTISPIYGGAALITALLVFAGYRHMAYKHFGGITGDLAGWFLQVLELAVPLVLGVLSYII